MVCFIWRTTLSNDNYSLPCHSCKGKLTSSGWISARSIASLMAMEPSLLADRGARLPRKLPMGVRTALTMNTSLGLEFFPKFRTGVKDLAEHRYLWRGLRLDLESVAIFL